MDEPIKTYFPILFPIFFACLWVLVTTLLGALSGWYYLMRKYPDRAETPFLQLKNQSGMMGIIRMARILNIAVCPSGLRIGIMKIFGIFSRDFFIPWQEIRVIRKDRFFWRTVELHFGEFGTLRIQAYVADRLARSAQSLWPEPSPFPPETHWQAFIAVAKLWLMYTTLLALFFIVAPRIVRIVAPTGAPDSTFPPVSVAILFPAIIMGVVCLVEYFQRIKR